jgi:LCP family protein required for cell wall assembly
MAAKNVTNKKKKKKFFKYMSLILFIISIISLGILFFLNVIPTIYFLILAIVILFLNLLVLHFLTRKSWKKKLLGTIISILLIILFIFVDFYSIGTLDFLNKIKGKDYNTENYSLIVLKSSNYENLKDLKDEDVGITLDDNDEGLKQATKYLNKKITVNYEKYDGIDELLKAFLNEDVEAILIEDAEKSILEEEYEEFTSLEKVIYTFSIDVKITDELAKNVDISKESFNIYISGIDTYGTITSVSRSDVNMVVTVNPTTHKILFTSIPRDYYVKLHGVDTTYKDKLTHAGIYGIDYSVKTIEDLLDIDINYYAKVNFTSLVDLVDELGGIEVDTDETFRAYYVENEVVDYTFNKGKNKLNGKQALAYSRERKSLATGDIARAKHQQQVLEAILNKALSKSIIIKYNDILNALEGKFVTNIGTKNLTSFIKKQIKNNPSWEITNNTLTGSSDYNYTYSYKSGKSYVMVPDEESVASAKELINNVLEGA